MVKVRFGDIVKEIKLNVDRNNNPYQYFVAGDHMDSENLKITRRGRFDNSDVGPAFIRVFKPGQVLYGSRITYLKKVAVADFEGITSNTTFVLESKDESIFLQRLLPFLMLSDKFTDFSIKNSKGSTNPYILFSNLAKFEFDLPALDEQKRLAELLWAANETKEAYKKLLSVTSDLVKAYFTEISKKCYHHNKVVYLEEIIQPDRPITYGILKPGKNTEDGVPVIKVKDYPNGIIDQSDLLYTSPEIDANYRRSKLVAGDLLVSIRGTVGRIAEVPDSLTGANITQDTARLSICHDYNRSFIRGVLESPTLQSEMDRHIRGVAVKGINLGDLRKILIPVPDRKIQDRLACFVEQSDKSKLELQQTISNLENTIKSILRQSLG